VSFYLRNSAECGSLGNTRYKIPHHMRHTNTQYSRVSDTQHTVFAAFLSFFLLRGAVFDDCWAGTLWSLELAYFTNSLSILNDSCSYTLSLHLELRYSRACEIASCTNHLFVFSQSNTNEAIGLSNRPLSWIYYSQVPKLVSLFFLLFSIWFVRLLALQPLLAYCASLSW
jgi:hypothetical protein